MSNYIMKIIGAGALLALTLVVIFLLPDGSHYTALTPVVPSVTLPVGSEQSVVIPKDDPLLKHPLTVAFVGVSGSYNYVTFDPEYLTDPNAHPLDGRHSIMLGVAGYARLSVVYQLGDKPQMAEFMLPVNEALTNISKVFTTCTLHTKNGRPIIEYLGITHPPDSVGLPPNKGDEPWIKFP
jgi:hypothetical protein